jgi:hypothetical protein
MPVKDIHPGYQWQAEKSGGQDAEHQEPIGHALVRVQREIRPLAYERGTDPRDEQSANRSHAELHGEKDPRGWPSERTRGEKQKATDKNFICEKTDQHSIHGPSLRWRSVMRNL